MSDRFSFPRSELRRRTLRGVMVTSGFIIAIDGLVLIQGLVVTRLLGPRDIGLYGIVSTFVVSIVALKRVGIDEAFVQQEEPDQEAEFQRAFTLELAVGAVFTALICALAPAVAAVYRDSRLLPLTLALAYLPLTFALQAPMWIFFRRMEYARQRSLQATQLLVGLVVTCHPFDQRWQSERAGPQTPFGLHLAVVACFRQRDAEVGIGVDKRDLVGETILARVNDAQRDAAIGAGRHGDAHEHAADHAVNGDFLAIETHQPSPLIGARIGRGETARREGGVLGGEFHCGRFPQPKVREGSMRPEGATGPNRLS